MLTVHDRSFEARPQDFTAYERLWHRLARPRALAASAARVVTPSAAVRDELVRAGWPVRAERFAVIREAPRSLPAGGAGAPRDPRVPERFVLAVGALEPRKGLDVLAAAARNGGIGLPVVLAGRGRMAAQLERVPELIVLGQVPDERLGALYRDAVALVQPSWLEGFGLPPVEAAAHGTPSVLSDLPVFRETLGEAALFVPPGNAEALGAALRRIAGDATLRDELGARAQAMIAPLSWERAAHELRAVLEAAAGGAAR